MVREITEAEAVVPPVVVAVLEAKIRQRYPDLLPDPPTDPTA